MKKIALLMSTSKTQHFINKAYVSYIKSSGFMPVLIVQDAHDTKDIAQIISESDGLMLPGGIDIDPIYYGEDNVASSGTDPAKDAFERFSLYEAIRQSKPIFGICRGFQLLARELLTMDEKISKYVTFAQHVGSHSQAQQTETDRNVPSHFVTIDSSILYGGESGTTKDIPVNSMHHQGLIVSITGYERSIINGKNKFVMAATTSRGIKDADKFVLCEAFIILGHASKILGVQWHPEELADVALLQNFFGDNNVENLLQGDHGEAGL